MPTANYSHGIEKIDNKLFVCTGNALHEVDTNFKKNHTWKLTLKNDTTTLSPSSIFKTTMVIFI